MYPQPLFNTRRRGRRQDDCWAKSRDPQSGVIQPDPAAFPQGMKAVADYVHGKGLLFGVYTDRGEHTCVGRPGSQGYEKLDAKTYAEWGVDCERRPLFPRLQRDTQPQPQPQLASAAATAAAAATEPQPQLP